MLKLISKHIRRFESNYSSCTSKSSENISRRTEGAFREKGKTG
jgi:hypothetical protein